MPRNRGSRKILKDAFSSSSSSFPFVQVLWCHFKETPIFSKTLSLRALRLCVSEFPGQEGFGRLFAPIRTYSRLELTAAWVSRIGKMKSSLVEDLR
jgi:hypothetical protein